MQVAKTWRARAVLAREAEYHKLAEAAVRNQEETARRLGELDDRLAQVQSRMASIERVLSEVE